MTAQFCNNLISASPHSHEWIGVLPLLHVINLKKFIIGEPYQLSLTEKDVVNELFCGVGPKTVTNDK